LCLGSRYDAQSQRDDQKAQGFHARNCSGSADS